MKMSDPEDSPSPCRRAGRSLIACPDCGREISPMAHVCVHCGGPAPGRVRLWPMLLAAAVVLGLAGFALYARVGRAIPEAQLPAPDPPDPVPAWEQALRARPRGSGYLGVMMRAPAEITFVAPDSPAEGADLHTGDVIVRVDGREVAHFRDYLRALWARRPGQFITLTIARGRATWTVNIRLARHPKD